MQEESWNEVKTEEPEKEKVEYEVEKEEPKKVEPEVKKKSQKNFKVLKLKVQKKRIRQLVKQRKEKEEQVSNLIRQNEELNSRLNNTQREFTNISKLNLDATENQLKDKLELARGAYQAAHEEGDSSKILKAQEFLNDAQNDLKSVGATKMQFREPEVQAPQQQVQQPYYQPQPTPDPKAQSWAEKMIGLVKIK